MTDRPMTDAEIIRAGMNGDNADEIVELAGELLAQFFLLMDTNDEVKELTDEERRFLNAMLRDGMNDTEDD